MNKQAIIYTRFSPRPGAEECKSCEKQIERCRLYCENCGYALCGDFTFSDKSVSGGSLIRPGLQAALNALTPGMVLVVDSSDRLARDMLVYTTIKHWIAQAGARVEYANGSPVGTTPEGELLEGVMALFAAYERNRIRLRTKNGLDKKRREGKRISGKIPIGYKIDPDNSKNLIENVTEKMALEYIRALSIDHKKVLTSEDIAELATEAFGPCRGKPWSARTIRRIIKKNQAEKTNGNYSHK